MIISITTINIFFLGWFLMRCINNVKALYRQGERVKILYPDRYKNQLSTHAFLAPKALPFPFNFYLVGTDRYGSYHRQFKKIVDIANSEKNSELLQMATKSYEYALVPVWLVYLWVFFLVVWLVVLYA